MRKKKLNIQFIFRLSVPPHIWKQDIQKIQPVFSYSLLILHCQFQYVLFMLNTLQSNDFRLVVNSIYCRFCSISYGSLIMCSKVCNINFFHLWPFDFQISSVLVCHVLALSRGAWPQKVNVFVVKFCFNFRCKRTPLYVDERRKNVSEAIHLDILCNSFMHSLH